jgi:gas vesicle protein
MADRDNIGALLAAFLLGALVGAGAALLTAPRSGKETREELRQWADGATQKAREKVKELYSSARERLSRHEPAEPERT